MVSRLPVHPAWGGRTRFWVLNVLLVFVISGVWHGAGWNFVLWGLLHAAYLIADRLIPAGRVPRVLARIGTLFAVFLAWLPFYETRSVPLFEKLRVLVTPSQYAIRYLREFIGQVDPSDLLLATTIFALSGAVFVGEWLSLRRGAEVYSVLRRPVLLIAMVPLTVWLAPTNNNVFIYFAF